MITPQAFKRHSKRLQEKMQHYDKTFSYCAAQEMFSQTLGFESYRELKTKLFDKREDKRTLRMHELKHLNSLSPDMLNIEYLQACRAGDLEKVVYLLTSPDLKRVVDIHDSKTQYQKDEAGLINACIYNQLAIVKYLLENTDSNPMVEQGAPILAAIKHNCQDVVEYLINKTNIKKHPLFSLDKCMQSCGHNTPLWEYFSNMK